MGVVSHLFTVALEGLVSRPVCLCVCIFITDN